MRVWSGCWLKPPSSRVGEALPTWLDHRSFTYDRQSTTKILAIGTFAPGTDMQLVQRTLAAEVRATAELYLEGKIDQWYSLESRPGVVFIVNVTDLGAAQAMLEALPLGKAHLMTFELYPIGPLKPLRQLLKSPETH